MQPSPTDSDRPRGHFTSLVYQVIGAAMAAHTALGPGHRETVYQRALVRRLHAIGLLVERQPRLGVRDRDGTWLGVCRPDLRIAGRLLVELKAGGATANRNGRRQLRAYLRQAGGTGLLLNFGGDRLIWRTLPMRRQEGATPCPKESC